MTADRTENTVPEESAAAVWAGVQNFATTEAHTDGDFPHRELLQVYITVSVFVCVWLAMALFFAELPQKLLG